MPAKLGLTVRSESSRDKAEPSTLDHGLRNWRIRRAQHQARLGDLNIPLRICVHHVGKNVFDFLSDFPGRLPLAAELLCQFSPSEVKRSAQSVQAMGEKRIQIQAKTVAR